jgi:DNA-binding response OmpR family regulator
VTQRPAAVSAAPPAGEPRATILLVDDDQHLRKILADLLTHHGFAVLQAASGPDALALRLDPPPDLVILDLRMPHMDGIELARSLRQFPETADVPMLMLTVETDVERWRQAKEAGVGGYLLKPCENEDLLREVRRLLAEGPSGGEEGVAAPRGGGPATPPGAVPPPR